MHIGHSVLVCVLHGLPLNVWPSLLGTPCYPNVQLSCMTGAFVYSCTAYTCSRCVFSFIAGPHGGHDPHVLSHSQMAPQTQHSVGYGQPHPHVHELQPQYPGQLIFVGKKINNNKWKIASRVTFVCGLRNCIHVHIQNVRVPQVAQAL